MRVAVGSPEIFSAIHQFALSSQQGGSRQVTSASSTPTGHINNEVVIEISLGPTGNVFSILTQVQVQFWSALQTIAQLAAVALPRCGVAGGSDSGHQLAWHPQGRTLAVSTLDRRLLFLEADIAVNNTNAVVTEGDTIRLFDAPSRVCVGFEIQLEFGLIVNMSSTSQALLVGTSGGYIVGIGWNRGRVLFSWSSSHILQRIVSTNSSGNSTAGGGVSPGHPRDFLSNSHSSMSASGSLRGSTSVALGGTTSLQPSVVVGGSITSFAYSSPHKLFVVILSDGSIGMLKLRSSDGSQRTSSSCSDVADDASPPPKGHREVQDAEPQQQQLCQGVCYQGLAATSVAINSRHSVLAIAASDSVLKFVRFCADDMSLSDLGTTGAFGVNNWHDDCKSLGGVRCFSWSPDEELLCVGFRKKGIAVFHYSGACIMSTFSRYEGVLQRTNLLQRGCASAAWDATGHRLLCCSGGNDAKQFYSFPFSKAACIQDPHPFASGAVVLHNLSSISFLEPDGEANDSDLSTGWDTVNIPQDYVHENFPISFCTSSSDGHHVACAGTFGAAVYSRKTRKWRLFSVKSQERNITCVASPCWLSNIVLALPVRNHNTKSFEVQFYPRYHLNDVSIIDRVKFERKPALVSSTARGCPSDSESTLLVTDTGNTLWMYWVEAIADNIIAPRSVGLHIKLLRCFDLHGSFAAPIQVVALPIPKKFWRKSPKTSSLVRTAGSSLAPQVLREGGVPLPLIALVRGDHSMAIVDGNNLVDGSAVAGSTPAASTSLIGPELTYHVWVHHSTPLFANSIVILCYGTDGLTLRWVDYGSTTQPPSQQPSTSRFRLSEGSYRGPQSCSGKAPQRIAEFDVEGLPLAVLPLDGVVIFAAEGIQRQVFASLPPTFQATIKPILFTHQLLLPLLMEETAEEHNVADDAEGRPLVEGWLHSQLQRLREHGSFVGTMDYLLHLILHDDRLNEAQSAPVSPTTNVPLCQQSLRPLIQRPTLGRRSVLHRAITILKRYPEFHTVMVGFVRKVDVSKWRIIFDVVGSPVDFFEDCLNSGNLVEAAHVVRVVMMDTVTKHKVKVPSFASSMEISSEENVPETPKSSSGGNLTLSPLEAASQCARKLFPVVLRRFDFSLAGELFRFMSMLWMELCTNPEAAMQATFGSGSTFTTLLLPGFINNPTGHSPQRDKDGIVGRALRSVWPRRFSTDPAADSQGSLMTSRGSLPRALDFTFTSPHSQDNIAAKALIDTFHSIRTELERVVMIELLSAGRLTLFFSLCDAFALDWHALFGSIDWELVNECVVANYHKPRSAASAGRTTNGEEEGQLLEACSRMLALAMSRDCSISLQRHRPAVDPQHQPVVSQQHHDEACGNHSIIARLYRMLDSADPSGDDTVIFFAALKLLLVR